MKRVRELILCLILVLAMPVSVSAQTDAEAEHVAVEAMAKVWDFDGGCLTDDASHDLLDEAVEKIEDVKNYDIWKDLHKMKTVARSELNNPTPTPQPSMTYYGNCRITFYTHTGQNTASGVYPTAHHTAANNTLPFGTRILVDGEEWVIEDRGDSGMGATGIDLFLDTEAECVQRGLYYTDVYIVG